MHKKLSLDLLFCNHFLDMIIKAYNKSNSSGVDFITIQHVSASRVKRRLTEHEKVFEITCLIRDYCPTYIKMHQSFLHTFLHHFKEEPFQAEQHYFPLPYLCVCVYIYVSAHVCTWKAEIDIWCLISTLFFEIRSLSELGTQWNNC